MMCVNGIKKSPVKSLLQGFLRIFDFGFLSCYRLWFDHCCSCIFSPLNSGQGFLFSWISWFFHHIIQKNISLVFIIHFHNPLIFISRFQSSLMFIIRFQFSLIFISHFQIQIIFINGFSSSISHENSILNTSHFSFQLIFINDFFYPISIHKNAHFSLIFQAISSIFINSFGITIEIFSLVNTSHFCSAISIINLWLQVTFASPLFKS